MAVAIRTRAYRVAVIAEIAPSALERPLPGGSPDTSVSLRLLRCGEMLAPPGFLMRESGFGGKLRGIGVGVNKRDQLWIPLPVFLVEHPTVGPILIDTGPPASAAHDTKAAFGRLGAAIYNIRIDPEEAVAARLRALGIEPSSLKTVVMTHLHLDHAGSISEFPNATIITTAAEWESAHATNGFRRGYIKRQFDHAFDYRLIDYDQTVNSFATFARSFDLFGDRSVVLVSTPGHSAGHQSVVLRLSGREVLICGDAAYTIETIDKGTPPLLLDDEHHFRRSLREIRSYRESTPSALVIPGHDAATWERLEPFYS